MELFSLNYTWFVLHYIFRYLGVNPCEKDEFDNLKPTSACCYWTRFICTNSLVLIIFAGSFLYQIFVETTPEEFGKAYRQTLATSTTTIIVLILFNSIIISLSFICSSKLRSFIKALSSIQEYFQQNSILDKSKIKQKLMAFYWTMIPYILLTILSMFLFATGVMYQLKSILNFSTLWTNITIGSCSLFLCMMQVPAFYFVFIYKELTILLGVWCDCLKEIKYAAPTLTKKANILIEAVHKIEEAFSSFLFWIISMGMTYIVVLSFISIIQLKDVTNMRWEKLCVFFSFTSNTFR